MKEKKRQKIEQIEGKGREGKGREGKGREGKGREGKGREGESPAETCLKKSKTDSNRINVKASLN